MEGYFKRIIQTQCNELFPKRAPSAGLAGSDGEKFPSAKIEVGSKKHEKLFGFYSKVVDFTSFRSI